MSAKVHFWKIKLIATPLIEYRANVFTVFSTRNCLSYKRLDCGNPVTGQINLHEYQMLFFNNKYNQSIKVKSRVHNNMRLQGNILGQNEY